MAPSPIKCALRALLHVTLGLLAASCGRVGFDALRVGDSEACGRLTCGLPPPPAAAAAEAGDTLHPPAPPSAVFNPEGSTGSGASIPAPAGDSGATETAPEDDSVPPNPEGGAPAEPCAGDLFCSGFEVPDLADWDRQVEVDGTV